MSWCSRFVRLCVCVPILVNDLFFFIKVPTHYYQIHYYRYRCTVQLTPGIQAWKQPSVCLSLHPFGVCIVTPWQYHRVGAGAGVVGGTGQ